MLQTTLTDSLADSLARAAPFAVETIPVEPLTAMGVLAAGGWALVPIAALLLAAIGAAVGIVRAASSAGDDGTLLRTVADYIREGNLVGAIDFCQSQDSVAARVVSEGVQRLGRPIGDIQTAVAAAARLEAERVRARLDHVRSAAVASVAVGLLGSTLGLFGAEALAGPLWPVLLSTAAGAGVALVVLVVLYAVAGRAAEVAASLDALTGDFVQMLRSPAERLDD